MAGRVAVVPPEDAEVSDFLQARKAVEIMATKIITGKIILQRRLKHIKKQLRLMQNITLPFIILV